MQSHSLLVNLRKMRKEPTCPLSFPPPHKDIDENRILMRWASSQNVELLFFFVDRCERIENSRFMLEKEPSRRSASWIEGWNQGRQLNTGNSKRRISRDKYRAGIELAYHKYELWERDRDKYPMGGEKTFLHALLSCSLDAKFYSPEHPLLQG